MVLSAMMRNHYSRFCAVVAMIAPAFLLFVRLYWGWQFAQTGWGKLQHLSRVAGFFDSLHIPLPYFNAVFVSWLEFVGGILLAVGLGSRLVAFLLVVDMLVAYLTAGRENLLSFFSNPGKFYGDDAFTFLFSALIILLFGSGYLALDRLIDRRLQRA